MKRTKIGYYALMCVASAAIGGCNDDGGAAPSPVNPEVCDAKLTPCLIGYSCVGGACLKNAAIGETCGDGIYCLDNGTCADGVCKAAKKEDENPNSGKIGSQCTTDTQCKEGTCLNRACTITAGAGEACSDSLPCASQYTCGEKNICLKTVGIGEACGETVVCRIGQCVGEVCTIMSEADLLKTTDTDGDTIPDYWDRCDKDTDGDTIPDCQDPDSDGDTIPDAIEAGTGRELDEAPYDADGDGIYDFLSADSDGNGIPDATEGICEIQKDEEGNALKDEDGMPVAAETCKPYVLDGKIVRNIDNIPLSDSDSDTIPDFQSLDNDSDGLLDVYEIVGFYRSAAGVNVPGRMCGSEPCAAGSPEAPWDSDGDTIPDYNDPDSDGDTIPDWNEAIYDTDGDGNLDIYDLDSDGDTIPDSVEKDWVYVSPDGLTARCVVSADCDGDGLIDSLEYAISCDQTIYPNTAEKPIFSPDSDNDGYSDAAEYAAAVYAIDFNKTDACVKDGNCYTVIDPASEDVQHPNTLVISKPEQLLCDEFYGVEDVFDFYFELPKGGAEQNKVLSFRPSVSRLDLVINLDVTGSMEKEISNIKGKLSDTIIPATKNRVSDSAFGISAFADFPVNLYSDKENKSDTAVRYGYPVAYGAYQADEPWKMLSSVTTNQSNLTQAVQTYALTDGADYPESGYESLWQIAGADTATAETATQYAQMGIKETRYGDGNIAAWKTIAPVTPEAGRWGGAQFRTGSLPVVVHVTDAPSHNSTLAPNLSSADAVLKRYDYDTKYIKNAHTDADVHKLYKDKGARLISVYRRSAADAAQNADGEGIKAGAQHPVLLNSSLETNAFVPVCAFKKGDAWKCGENKCCTVATAENSVDPDADNQCALSYGIQDGATLTETLVDGIDALVKYGTNDVAARIIGSPIAGSDKTTACFIKRVEAKQYVAPPQEPEKSCNPVAEAKKFSDENGNAPSYFNGFTNFAAGTSSSDAQGAQLEFTVVTQNDGCVDPISTSQTFSAQIELYNPTTQLSLGKREVYIIVPGETKSFVVN